MRAGFVEVRQNGSIATRVLDLGKQTHRSILATSRNPMMKCFLSVSRSLRQLLSGLCFHVQTFCAASREGDGCIRAFLASRRRVVAVGKARTQGDGKGSHPPQ